MVFNTQLMEKNHNRLHPASTVAQNGVAKPIAVQKGRHLPPFFLTQYNLMQQPICLCMEIRFSGMMLSGIYFLVLLS